MAGPVATEPREPYKVGACGALYNRSATGNRLTGFNGLKLAYDADGNLTRRSQLNGSGSVVSDDRLFWNSLGQMDSTMVLGTNGCRIPLGYDGLTGRIRCAARTGPRTTTNSTIRATSSG